MTTRFYGEDLAHIHHVGFGGVAAAAAAVLVDELARAGLRGGCVVDLGCGSGILARQLCDSGHPVVGFDLAPAFLALAGQVAPAAELHRGSLWEVDLPACVAVAAVGEALCYRPAPAAPEPDLEALFARVSGALPAGGIFLFDVAGPTRGHRSARRHLTGDDWAVLVELDEDERASSLRRRIIAFRRVGELYRRSDETHHLRLHRRATVIRALRRTGFEAEARASYAGTGLPPGVTAFVARKRG